MSLEPIALAQMAGLFARLGILSFGGGTTVLAEMERDVVGRGWLSHEQFLEAYALGQLTPGPGMTLVVPIGYRLDGVLGAAVAFAAFFLPPAIIAFAAVVLWHRVGNSPVLQVLKIAIMPVAAGLTLASAYTLGVGATPRTGTIGIAAFTTLLLLRTRIPAPAILLGAGMVGAVLPWA